MKKEMPESRKRANLKWDSEHLKRISVAMRVEDYDAMEEHLSGMSESRNHFINRAISSTILADNSETIHKSE